MELLLWTWILKKPGSAADLIFRSVVFRLSDWKTESIVCALIYPNAQFSERIEFPAWISNAAKRASLQKLWILPRICHDRVWINRIHVSLHKSFLCRHELPPHSTTMPAMYSCTPKNGNCNSSVEFSSVELFMIRSTMECKQYCNYNSQKF